MNIGEGSEDNNGTSSKEDMDVQKKCGAEGTDVNTSQATSKCMSDALLIVGPLLISLPKYHFAFTAATPEAKKLSCMKRLIQRLFKRTREQEMTSPVSTLASWPGYHTCGNIKGKEKNSQKGKREKGKKGNFLRFISTVIFPMIEKSRKSFEKYIAHSIMFT